MEYCSNGKGNAALTLGIIGTGLSVLGGGLGSIFGGNSVPVTCGSNNHDLLTLSVQNALLQSELSADRKVAELRSELSAMGDKINNNAAAQALINCGFSNTNTLLNSQVDTIMGFTKTGINSDAVISTSTSA